MNSINCDICHSRMRLPYAFVCGHTFCISCTALYFKSKYNNDCLCCPICRKSITHVLPNYTLRTLLGEDTVPISDPELQLIKSLKCITNENNLIIRNKLRQKVIYLIPYNENRSIYNIHNINMTYIYITLLILVLILNFIMITNISALAKM